jgi:hypothetical protein
MAMDSHWAMSQRAIQGIPRRHDQAESGAGSSCLAGRRHCDGHGRQWFETRRWPTGPNRSSASPNHDGLSPSEIVPFSALGSVGRTRRSDLAESAGPVQPGRGRPIGRPVEPSQNSCPEQLASPGRADADFDGAVPQARDRTVSAPPSARATETGPDAPAHQLRASLTPRGRSQNTQASTTLPRVTSQPSKQARSPRHRPEHPRQRLRVLDRPAPPAPKP